MTELNAYIKGLTEKVERLARLQSELTEQNVKLKAENETLRMSFDEQKNTLERLQEENKVVKIAKAVTEDDEDRKNQKKRLNELVREVDKCIALLNN